MERNTILIDLEEYDELRDFKKGIIEGKVCYRTTYPWSRGNYFLYGESDLVKINESVEETKAKLWNELVLLKKMSSREFRNWKKKSLTELLSK